MMFRYGKIIESNSKSSRSDRFAEMSKQQQLIESKKQEIKAKFEERKRQEAEEALKKLDNKSTLEHKSNKDHKSLLSSRMQSWKNDDRWRKKHQTSEQNESSNTNNFFSNDGSFLEKYKKLAGAKSEDEAGNEEGPEHQQKRLENQQKRSEHQQNRLDRHQNKLERQQNRPEHQQNTFENDMTKPPPIDCNRLFLPNRSIDTSIPPHATYDASCRKGIPYPPPNMISSSLAVTSQQQSLYSLTSHPPPTAPPPSSAIHTSLAAVPASVPLLTAVPSSGASLQTVSLIQVPVSVPASSVILSCPLETTLVTSEPVVHLPVVHSTLPPNSITVPLQTTVIPAQIQITSQASMSQSSVQTVQINQSSTNVILSQTLQPQSILVPSECIQSQQPLPMVQPSQLPSHSVYSTMSNTSVNYSIPPPSQESGLPPIHLPPPNYTPVVPAAHHQDPNMRGVPNLPFPNCKSSQFINEKDGYCIERSLITSESDDRYQNSRSSEAPDRMHGSKGLEEIETIARVVADCGDDMENILLNRYPDDEKLWFLKDKLSPPYVAFRNMVERMRRDRVTNSQNRSFNGEGEKRHSKVPADDDDSDSEENEERRRRKRKRRSRWAPENDKIEVPPVVVPSHPPPNISVATPSSLGTVVPVAPPTQDRKLPGISGPLISQVTRTDPALVQYALKSFGTVNLSEEDWKKAEDHYKINLLYQDMLKKRQELERLQAAGRYKYVYDSDEDTEGGTWEHKLRQQEMVATQLWADELTERAKGKHHIGDFLPPDELERFMEKYNALKQGREPDLSDYKEFKLKEDNIGFQMLQKLGWSEGQGLGSEGTGIVNPVNKAPAYSVSHGLGIEKPDDITRNDDEFDAYRKRMMLAYRFRPNPLNNPRRPYY